jgi:hypothetical protein
MAGVAYPCGGGLSQGWAFLLFLLRSCFLSLCLRCFCFTVQSVSVDTN